MQELKKNRVRWGIAFFLTAAVVLIGSLAMFRWQYWLTEMDLRIHASIAADFDFADLHSITSRISYPVWHLIASTLYQLGMPLDWAAALVCALFKLCNYVLSYWLIARICKGQVKPVWIALIAGTAMIVTGVYVADPLNPGVYLGVGSPNVWHNPTQQAAITTMLLCVPYVLYCWYDFEARVETEGEKTMLPWYRVLILAALLIISLACKPTVMQALLPAAFVMFLVELCRRPRNWRYFGQIVLAFLPAAAYFLLQYLYYTGVLVPFTSGVEVGFSWAQCWKVLRGTLLMNVFPLYAVACCYRKGIFKNRLLVLSLLMVAFSTVEFMLFSETGLREGHGNFGWANMSSSFMLWVVMLGVFLRSFCQENGGRTLVRKLIYGAGWALWLWHVASGIYYLYFLVSTGSAF
ncbi:MAG: hypothetical protein E7319_01005 [Clostridiales bacterium]|nr:hypothetical protein [Clostridiales bacterium]